MAILARQLAGYLYALNQGSRSRVVFFSVCDLAIAEFFIETRGVCSKGREAELNRSAELSLNH